MSQIPISIPPKRLSSALASTGTTLTLNNIKDWNGVALTASSFGTKLYAVLHDDANTLYELIELDPATIASASITILNRGLAYDDSLTVVAANKLNWPANTTIVELGTHTPALLGNFMDLGRAQTAAGVKTFSSVPVTTGGDPVNANDLARKSYVDGLTPGTLTNNKTIVPGTAGETVAAGNPVYLKAADGRWWKTDAATAATVQGVQLGIAQGAGVAAGAITGGVLIRGLDSNQSGLTAGTLYYFANGGGVGSSAGTNKVSAGNAKSATELYFSPQFAEAPKGEEKDALAGTNGTPSSTNKYVTSTDPALPPTGSVVLWTTKTAPTGWLISDGSAVSRTTYATLFSKIAPSLGTFTVTIASPAVFSLTAHGLVAGDPVYFTTTGALPTGLSVNTLYYVISAGLTANAFEVSTTRGGAAVNTSGTQSGTHTAVYCPFGLGDASTTFNLPDLRANVPAGFKSADGNMGYLGQAGGEATHVLTTAEMPSHQHAITVTADATNGILYPKGAGTAGTPTNATNGPNNTGGDGAHQNLQPYITLIYIIKT